MEWSKIMQPPDYLKATRLAYLNEEFAGIIAKHCGIFNGSKVLEVGCGTGCFSHYLSAEVENVEFLCLDRDKLLIENGQKMQGVNNSAEYIFGSAFELPFEDDSFDAVYSHTFFNCVESPEKAMDEMKRVIKHGKRITSVTSMSLSYETWYTGDYPEECNSWCQDISKFSKEIFTVLEKLNMGPFSLSKGYPASKIPSFFTRSGLKEINIFPLSRAFSLSNALLSKDKKLLYIENLYRGEIQRLSGAMENEEFIKLFSIDKCEAYKSALKKRTLFWKDNLDDNSIWDWFGSSSLLVSGEMKK